MKFSQQQKQLEANGKYFISNILFQPPQKKKSNSSRLESAKTHQWLYTDARSTMKMTWKLVTSSRRNFGLWCVNAV